MLIWKKKNFSKKSRNGDENGYTILDMFNDREDRAYCKFCNSYYAADEIHSRKHKESGSHKRNVYFFEKKKRESRRVEFIEQSIKNREIERMSSAAQKPWGFKSKTKKSRLT